MKASMLNIAGEKSVDDQVIAIAPRNEAILRNDRIRAGDDLSRDFFVAQHFALFRPQEHDLTDLDRLFNQEESFVSFAQEFIQEIWAKKSAAADLVLHRNRFNSFINDVVIEEVIVCRDGLVLVTDAVLEQTGDVDFKATSVINDISFWQYIRKSFKSSVGIYVDFVISNSFVDGDSTRFLWTIGPKRAHGLVLAPINKVMKSSVRRFIRRLRTNNPVEKFFMEHTCRIPDTMKNRGDLLDAAKNGGFTCENLRGRNLEFTYNPDGKYDGLEVNGVAIPKVFLDVSASNGFVLPLDGFLVPVTNDLKTLWRD
jgi:hypothetical protein